MNGSHGQLRSQNSVRTATVHIGIKKRGLRMEYEMIEKTVELLADKLGPMGEKTWELAVRQVYVDVAQSFVFGIVAIYGIMKLAKPVKEAWSEDISDMDPFTASVGLVALVLLSVGLVISVQTTIQNLLNPEWVAIKMILGMVN